MSVAAAEKDESPRTQGDSYRHRRLLGLVVEARLQEAEGKHSIQIPEETSMKNPCADMLGRVLQRDPAPVQRDVRLPVGQHADDGVPHGQLSAHVEVGVVGELEGRHIGGVVQQNILPNIHRPGKIPTGHGRIIQPFMETAAGSHRKVACMRAHNRTLAFSGEGAGDGGRSLLLWAFTVTL